MAITTNGKIIRVGDFGYRTFNNGKLVPTPIEWFDYTGPVLAPIEVASCSKIECRTPNVARSVPKVCDTKRLVCPRNSLAKINRYNTPQMNGWGTNQYPLSYDIRFISNRIRDIGRIYDLFGDRVDVAALKTLISGPHSYTVNLKIDIFNSVAKQDAFTQYKGRNWPITIFGTNLYPEWILPWDEKEDTIVASPNETSGKQFENNRFVDINNISFAASTEVIQSYDGVYIHRDTYSINAKFNWSPFIDGSVFRKEDIYQDAIITLPKTTLMATGILEFRLNEQ